MTPATLPVRGKVNVRPGRRRATGNDSMKAACLFAVMTLAGGVLAAQSGCDAGPGEPRGTGRERRAEGRPRPRSQPVFHGMSDASAAVAVDGETFIVADDENNVLRLYRTGGGAPVADFDLTRFLRVEPEFPEADIEAATRVGNRVYWITSHGRNRDGKWRPNRYRFFATTVSTGRGGPAVQGVGLPYTRLADTLAADPAVAALCPDLADSLRAGRAGEKGPKRLAPKKAGLNIEALAAAPDGKTLYIGLRNPRAGGAGPARRRAIVVPLKNAAEVIDAAKAPLFGAPLLWDLAQMGLRSMEYSPSHGAYYIVAGPHDGRAGWGLYRWSGAAGDQPAPVSHAAPGPSPLCPEALIVFKDSRRLLLLSDDGALHIRVAGEAECLKGQLREDGTCLNKHLRDEKRRHFRGMWLDPPAPRQGQAKGQ